MQVFHAFHMEIWLWNSTFPKQYSKPALPLQQVMLRNTNYVIPGCDMNGCSSDSSQSNASTLYSTCAF